jgi:predicted O-methyltransferase YrrM
MPSHHANPPLARSADKLRGELIQRRCLVGRTGKRFDSLGAQSTPNNLHVLQELFRRFNIRESLEIGFCYGASAAVIAACFRDRGEAGRGQHIAVDPYQKTYWDDTGRLTLEEYGLADHVTILEEVSDIALPKLVSEGWQCDMAYVDGSHLFEDVFIDFYYVNLLLRKDGIVLFDDSSDPNVRKVLRFIRRNRGDSYSELDLDPYRTAATTIARRQIARLIGRVQLTGFQKTRESRRPWNASFHNF